ncbi:MAG: mycofactocin system glycosyltransferase, partial [Tomitella sp.]|nr:mycofactocin system glycosyltransferase [Tomitella sp.]
AARLLAMGFVSAIWQLALGVCRHYWPLAVVTALVSQRARRIVLVTAAAEGAVDWYVRDVQGGTGRRRMPRLDPVRYIAFKRLDDAGYGAGLWRGAIRARSVAALLPRRG